MHWRRAIQNENETRASNNSAQLSYKLKSYDKITTSYRNMYYDKKSKISCESSKHQNKSQNDCHSQTKTYRKQKLGITISNWCFMGKTKLLKTTDSSQAYAWIHGLNNCHYWTQHRPDQQLRNVNSEVAKIQFTSYIN